MADLAVSTLAKLKNIAKEKGLPFQQILNLFCQEEFIRRFADSEFKDKLILKGGFLIYSISGFAARPTVDADYLLRNHPNDEEAVEKLIQGIIGGESGLEYLTFELKRIEKILESKEYHGLRVYLIGRMGNTKTPFTIDFGIGDVVVPSAVKRELQVLLPEFGSPAVLTYSLESTIAEKFEAMIAFMEFTGRMKDFYDIYYLATTFQFDGADLQRAIAQTLKNRRTPYAEDSIEEIMKFGTHPEINKRWKIFCSKVLEFDLDFKEVLELLNRFLAPPYDAIVKEKDFRGRWNNIKRNYTEIAD